MKDHVKNPSVFDICPISTNNSSDATHYKRRTQYQQNNVWMAIQICLALYTYNLNINHQWFFYTCVTICNMDLYIIKKKGAGSCAYVMLWKQSLIDDIFYISINSLVGFFNFLSTFLIIQVIRWFPLIFLSESCEQQLLTNLKKKKMEKKVNHTHKSLVMSYGSYTKDFNRVGVWGVKLEFYENGRFIKSTF